MTAGPPTVTPAEAGAELAGILDAVETLYRTYVVFVDDHQAVAVTLWTAHTHVYDQFEVVPYLAVTSAEKRSGKTRVFDVAEGLVARPWRVVQPSEAVVYRKIARDHPTLLIDEVDTLYGPAAKEHEGLRAILNSGFAAGQTVPRCSGPNQQLVDFDVFTPKGLAGIGDLPDTVADRSIPIRMRRKAPHERALRFRRRDVLVPLAAPIRVRIEMWAAAADLAGSTPDLPGELHDRAADAWEGLLAIADAAGGAWPKRARDAAVDLHSAAPDDTSLGIRLLGDIRRVFTSGQIGTAELIKLLLALEESPWGEVPDRGSRDGKPLNARRLASLLNPYKLHSKNIKQAKGQATKVVKGYTHSDFRETWLRYLPPSEGTPPEDAATSRYPATAQVSTGFGGSGYDAGSGTSATSTQSATSETPSDQASSGVAAGSGTTTGGGTVGYDHDHPASPCVTCGRPCIVIVDGARRHVTCPQQPQLGDA